MTDEADRKKKHRSPPHPFFSLREAINRAGEFYKDHRTNPTSIQAAMTTWGQDPKSGITGVGGRIVSALKQFGLMEETDGGATRRLKLTDLGRRLVLLPESDSRRPTAIREAALRPKIHEELVKYYPERLPSDQELKTSLELDRGFNPDAIPAFIKQFRDTCEYAALYSDDRLTPAADEFGDLLAEEGNPHIREALRLLGGEDPMTTAGTPPAGALETPPLTSEAWQNLTFRITGDRTVIVRAPLRLTAKDFKLLKKHMELLEEAASDDEA